MWTSSAFWLSLLAFVVTFSYVAVLTAGVRRLRVLAEQPSVADVPSLMVIVPAMNEAHALEPALRSLLASDFPSLQIVAVNDRSTDATGEIMERLANEDPRLTVIHVSELPERWLGKVHAMQVGLARARGDYVLLTDADVQFSPQALRQAVGYAHSERLDHLTVVPQIEADSHLLRMMVSQHGAFLMAQRKPWRLRDDPEAYLGIGAFNLVHRPFLERHGGLEPLALSPVDDVSLGKLIKLRGGRSDALLGAGAVRVRWYATAKEMVHGLSKNMFAYLDYSMGKLMGATVFSLVMLWPLIGLFVGPGAGRLLSLGALLLLTLSLHDGLRRMRPTRDWPLLPMVINIPLANLVALYTLWRASLLTLWRQEIEWRGTRYPLAALKARHF
ncbi:MAG: glycosyltransferase [Ectothiorhodospiraceae bacterium]|nr:glycosyltransferase [Ectothiorhodospiraceae bacterium]